MEKYPITENGIIYRNPNTFFRHANWATVCRDDEGTLYTVFSGFRAAHVCPFGKTCLCKSFDNGKTWSAPIVVNDTWLDDRDAGIVCLGGRKILVTWFCHPADFYVGLKEDIVYCFKGSESVLDQYHTIPEEKSKGGSFIRVSEDGGATWGEIIQVPVTAPHGPILRRDGSLLYLGKEMTDYPPAGVDPVNKIFAVESRDEGKTWQILGGVPLPDAEGIQWYHMHEPHVLELEDRKLLSVIRGHHPYHSMMYITESLDGGKTWAVPTALPYYGLPPHIMQHSSGALIVTFGYREEPFGERAMVSYDGGKTWPDLYILRNDAPDLDLGYPATVELDDHSLLTVYYQRIPGDGFACIQYTKWSL